MSSRRSFATKLALWMLLAAGVPFAIAAALGLHLIATQARHSVGLEAIAMRQAAHQALAQMLEDRQLLFHAALAAPALRDPAPEVRLRTLRRYQQANPAWRWLGIADPAGRLVATSHGPLADLAGQPAFEAGKARVCLADVRYEPAGQLVARLTGPLQGKDGKIGGVLLVDVDLAPLDGYTRHLRIRGSGETYLVRGDGTLLTSSRFDDGARGALKVASLGFREARAGREGLAEYVDYRGVPVLGAYTPFEPGAALPGEPAWVLISEIDLQEALAPLHDLERRLGLLALGAAALFVVVLAATSRMVTRPLRALEAAATGIAAGDWQRRVAVPGRDEFGRLGAAFNAMAAKVDETLGALVQSNRKLQELDQLKTAFVNAVTHDLRTPLTTILGYEEMLEDGPTTEEQAKALRIIRRSTLRLADMLDDLLDFARMEAGAFHLVLDEVDLAAVILEAVDAFRPQLEAAGLALELDLPAGLPRVQADGDRVARILANYLGNAAKFTPAGGTVRVALRQEGPALVLGVADTGPGVAPEDVPKLFRRFSQLEAGKRHRGGTGLGLSICRMIAEAHGGTVGVATEPGHGATFWFRLPI